MANDDFSETQLQTLEKLFRRVLDERLLEERTYLTQLFRQELRELREAVDKLDRREDTDAMASVEELEAVKERLTKLEEQFAKLTLANS